MRAPGFWFTPPDRPALAARLLSPLGAVYATATARRLDKAGWKAPVPVICIGNLNAGGTGKTPTVIALTRRLADRGLSPHVVSRGHGGSLTGPVRVDPALHGSDQTGDEPLLIARTSPVWVARDRAAGVRAAVEAGAGVVVLDDGFQNPSVVKDISVIVVDAPVGFGNGLCLPAGPLREPVAKGLARADLLLSIGPPADQARFSADWGNAIPLPRLIGHLAPAAESAALRGRRVLAFAGIGRPEKFFDSLRATGAAVAATHALADHQPLSEALVAGLLDEAQKLGAAVITTEKDAVRLPPAFRDRIMTLPVGLEVQDWAPFDSLLMRKLGKPA